MVTRQPKKKRDTKIITNPNKINQYTDPDPRQALFLDNYLNPKSVTFSNCTASGLAAGYTQEYSENLVHLMPDWLSKRLGDMNHEAMLRRAESNLKEIMELPTMVQAMGPFGPLFKMETKRVKVRGKWKIKKVPTEPIMTFASPLLKLKNDASQFVAERIGKAAWAKETGSKPNVIVPVQVNIGDERGQFA